MLPSRSRYEQAIAPKTAGDHGRSGKRGAKRKETIEDGEEEGSEDDLDKISQDTGAETVGTGDSGSEAEGENEEDEEGDDAEDVDSSSNQDQIEAAEILEAARRQSASDDKDSRKRKRNHRDDDADLEGRYLQKLQEFDEPGSKRLRDENGEAARFTNMPGDDTVDDQEFLDGDIPIHESLQKGEGPTELEKANCTAFLSNVSAEAVTSKKAKKTLLVHLSSVLDKSADPPQAIESLRFRSTAYSTVALPKRASFAQGSVMDATTKCTNAYVVYNSPSAVRTAVAKLNGSLVLDRHLRVDSVAHPAPQDHKRCVFVGNLGFVNDETVLNSKVDEGGQEVTEKRKRTRQPMDVEEGLWRIFGQEGRRVESVRVVRDPITRVGKGFAYVQFYVSPPSTAADATCIGLTASLQDANDVEAALLLADKSFPPMLSRKLRVSRCKAPQKTERAIQARRIKGSADAKPGKGPRGGTGYVPKPTAKEQSLAGRAGKLLGRAAASHLGSKDARPGKKPHRREGTTSHAGPEDRGVKKSKSPEQVVFEGRRASAKDGKPKDLRFKGTRSGAGRKAGNRASARAKAWKMAARGGAGKK